jgi:acetoin utilization deacetylase AcuC-like enzyme
VNLPVPPGSGDPIYRSLVEHVAVPLLEAFEPQLVLVSAGYDAHRDDPLADCTVTEEGFAGMTRAVRRTCQSRGAALGFVLEGGYALRALARSVAATMQELAPGVPVAGGGEELPMTSLAREARQRLLRWWPALAT